MGHGAWGMGNGDEGDKGDKGEKGERLLFCLQCPMPNAQCPVTLNYLHSEHFYVRFRFV